MSKKPQQKAVTVKQEHKTSMEGVTDSVDGISLDPPSSPQPQASSPRQRETDTCNRCDKDHSLNPKTGYFHHHHLSFERDAVCRGSLKPPRKIYAEDGANEAIWGSCNCCTIVFALTAGEDRVVEEHFWGLRCPGTGKKPEDVHAVPGPGNLVYRPFEADKLTTAMGKLTIEGDGNSSSMIAFIGN